MMLHFSIVTFQISITCLPWAGKKAKREPTGEGSCINESLIVKKNDDIAITVICTTKTMILDGI